MLIEELLDLCSALLDPQTVLGARAREDMKLDGGLSAAMVEWGLRTTLRRFTRRSLEALVGDDLRGARVTVLLADSVPTAPLRAVALPLLRGAASVMLRASSRQPRFVSTLIDALSLVQPWVLSTTPADLVIAYGRDDTLEGIEASLGANVKFEGHGHGFGALLVDNQPLTASLVESIAWDVCAYDQRGCLSPQVVFALCDSAQLAELLIEALDGLGESFPRGPLDLSQGARVMQWQGALAASGARLLRGRSGSVAVIDPIRMVGSPGARNIAVVQARNTQDIHDALAPHARFLSCLGLSSRELVQALPAHAHARVVPVGEMQDPALDGPEDPRGHLARALTPAGRTPIPR